MFQKLSRWENGGDVTSPDGKYTLLYRNGSEIAMGAPTVGELWLADEEGNEQLIAKSVTASMIWSQKSDFFAYVKWGEFSRHSETICVVRVTDMLEKSIKVENSSIEFQAFGRGFIKLLDYPAYNIVGRAFNVKALFEE
ncbi:hypothetical protein ACPWUF_01655 [Bisgaard Taxon 46]